MTQPGSTQFDHVLSQALKLSPAERIAIIERLAASFKDIEPPSDTPLADEEIAELTRIEPLSPVDVVALGLLGTWADQNISDGAEWVNERKRQRRERRKW